MANPLILLTGPQGIGKTTLCLRLAEQFTAHRKDVAGIVTRTMGQQRYAHDLSSGQQRLLAEEGDQLAGPRWGRFSFSADTCSWGNEIVARAVSGSADLVILDEIGPLELVAGHGFLPALKSVLTSDKAGLIVVRPALVEQASRIARPHPVRVWTVSTETREELQQLAALLSISRHSRMPDSP